MQKKNSQQEKHNQALVLHNFVTALKDGYNQPDKVPADWATVAQIAGASGISVSQVSKYVRIGIKNGKVEMKKFRINVNGVVRPVPHYRQ